MKALLAACMAVLLTACHTCPPRTDQLILKVDPVLMERPQGLSKLNP